ncbi:hypothetical protein Tco_0713186, partial [Tanacetum coccineum]
NNFHGHDCKTCLVVLIRQFKEFLDSKEMKEKEVQAIKEIERRLQESATLEACLVNKGIAVNDNMGVMESSGIKSENSSSETSFSRSVDENRSFDIESSSSEGNHADVDIGSSNDSDSVLRVYHDLFKNMFAHGIQNHKQLESIPDTYVVNENNRNIISDIPNMDPDRNKEEHNYVDYE